MCAMCVVQADYRVSLMMKEAIQQGLGEVVQALQWKGVKWTTDHVRNIRTYMVYNLHILCIIKRIRIMILCYCRLTYSLANRV